MVGCKLYAQKCAFGAIYQRLYSIVYDCVCVQYQPILIGCPFIISKSKIFKNIFDFDIMNGQQTSKDNIRRSWV